VRGRPLGIRRQLQRPRRPRSRRGMNRRCPAAWLPHVAASCGGIGWTAVHDATSRGWRLGNLARSCDGPLRWTISSQTFVRVLQGTPPSSRPSSITATSSCRPPPRTACRPSSCSCRRRPTLKVAVAWLTGPPDGWALPPPFPHHRCPRRRSGHGVGVYLLASPGHPTLPA
jgi:hypothetical protein